jgi:hypothetical protein
MPGCDVATDDQSCPVAQHSGRLDDGSKATAR